MIYVFSYFFLQVNQRNVPGIDAAYLAMDTEEGVEVVWNEVMISERKNFKLLEVSHSEGKDQDSLFLSDSTHWVSNSKVNETKK